eukprot:TRINITY_DN2316_c0_g1_i4.p1 TRINITY_DN2316_c0_g1~~TRINITY_DN2316_c0_g1_i4.p1  ORF type:complete len:532 (-),score=110.35 TRINITY_DN2316_c0_g1_i4:359-1954(-)
MSRRFLVMLLAISIVFVGAIYGIPLEEISFKENPLQSTEGLVNTYLVINAKVYTVDNSRPTAEGFLVQDGIFMAVGTTRELLERYPQVPIFDAKGSAIVPGMIDAHAHLLNLGYSLNQADLRGCTSPEEVVQRLLPFAADLPAGAWLQARGWDQERFVNPVFPTKEDLDEAFPDIPVWLTRIDGHAAWSNTKALQLAGPLPPSDPPGGSVVRDQNGEPTGIFIDNAMDLVSVHIPPPNLEEKRRAVAAAVEACLSTGVTSMHDAGSPLEDINFLIQATDENLLRIRAYVMASNSGNTPQHWEQRGPIIDYRGRLTVRSTKIVVDGALGSRGAALLEPYTDDPGNYGLVITPLEQFKVDAEKWMRIGFQVNSHAIGDAANRIVLDGYEYVLDRLPTHPDLRLRIEHAQIVNMTDFERFRQMSIIASMQPTHATSDKLYAEERLGPERIKGAYAWRTFLNYGVHLAFSSDFPIEPVNPLIGFYSAITRQDPIDGSPPGGWYPEQLLTREEALKAFTLDAAYAAFQVSHVFAFF